MTTFLLIVITFGLLTIAYGRFIADTALKDLFMRGWFDKKVRENLAEKAKRFVENTKYHD